MPTQAILQNLKEKGIISSVQCNPFRSSATNSQGNGNDTLIGRNNIKHFYLFSVN
jgi:hypothetical protein